MTWVSPPVGLLMTNFIPPEFDEQQGVLKTSVAYDGSSTMTKRRCWVSFGSKIARLCGKFSDFVPSMTDVALNRVFMYTFRKASVCQQSGL